MGITILYSVSAYLILGCLFILFQYLYYKLGNWYMGGSSPFDIPWYYAYPLAIAFWPFAAIGFFKELRYRRERRKNQSK